MSFTATGPLISPADAVELRRKAEELNVALSWINSSQTKYNAYRRFLKDKYNLKSENFKVMDNLVIEYLD
jgi:hypothetical protein